jgi:hypothetical protein
MTQGNLEYDPLREFVRLARYGEISDLTPEVYQKTQQLLAKYNNHELSLEQISWATKLGRDDAALACLMIGCGPISLVDWSDFVERRKTIFAVGRLLSRQMLVSYVCDAAERILPIFENNFPDDNRPRKAIELAQRWSRGEKISRKRLAEAYNAAFLSANLPIETAAREQLARVAYEDGHAAAYAAAYTADTAVFADVAAYPTADYAFTSLYGASAVVLSFAATAVRAIETTFAEFRWQQLRLAKYVLGEVI